MKKQLSTVILALLSISVLAQTDYFIFVSDAGGFNSPPWQILRYDLNGDNPVVFIPSQTFEDQNVGWPQDILLLEDQNVILISCLVGNRITRHNANTGEYIDDFAAVAGGPTRMKIGPDDLIYVTQWSVGTNRILRYEQDGTFVDEYTNDGVPRGIGIDWDANDNLYVTSYSGNSVTQFDDTGVSQGNFITTNLNGPTNILSESDGNFLVLNWSIGTIERFDNTGNFIETFTTEVTQPEGIAINPINGNYLVGNGGPGRVDEFEPDGTYVGPVFNDGFGGLIQPNAVVVIEASLGIEEAALKEVLLYPSIGTIFNLNVRNTMLDEGIEILNLQGQIIASLNTNQTQWDAANIAEGIYFVRSSKNNRLLQKIIVKK